MNDECFECNGGDHEEFEYEMMEKFGWYAHFIIDEDEQVHSDMVNIHTHGLEESFDHIDMQIVFPIHPKVAMNLFHILVDRIKNGETFKTGINYDDIIKDHGAKFILAYETNRQVMRLILPDQDGNINPGTFKDPRYEGQYQLNFGPLLPYSGAIDNIKGFEYN